jgi:hypothetical protein
MRAFRQPPELQQLWRPQQQLSSPQALEFLFRVGNLIRRHGAEIID